MSNYYETKLIVTGPEAVKEKFNRLLWDEHSALAMSELDSVLVFPRLSFERIVPAGHVYERHQRWGCSDTENVVVELPNLERVHYTFGSINGAPAPWVRAAALRFPTLTFRLTWSEDLTCVRGKFAVRDGNSRLTVFEGDLSGNLAALEPDEMKTGGSEAHDGTVDL